MASVRITKAIAEEIREKAVSISKAKEEYDQACEEWYAAANKARIAIIGGPEADKELIALAKKYAKDLSDTSEKFNDFRLNKNHSHVRMDTSANIVDSKGNSLHPTDRWGFVNFNSKGIAVPTPYTLRVTDPVVEEELKNAQLVMKQAHKQFENFRADLYHAVLGAGTIKKLLQQWPHIEECIPSEYLNPPVKNLPAIPVAAMNAKIGLPTKKAKTKTK